MSKIRISLKSGNIIDVTCDESKRNKLFEDFDQSFSNGIIKPKIIKIYKYDGNINILITMILNTEIEGISTLE